MNIPVGRIVAFVVTVIIGWGEAAGLPSGLLELAQEGLLYVIPLAVLAIPGIEKWKNLFELVSAVIDHVETAAIGQSNANKEALAVKLIKEYAGQFKLGFLISVLVRNSSFICRLLTALVPVVKVLLRVKRVQGVASGKTLLDMRLREITVE